MSIQTISSVTVGLGTRVADPTPAAPPNSGAQQATAALESVAASAPNQIQNALDEVRAAIAPVAQNLQFTIDDDTGHTVIKIIDSSTDEVIKQIPSEEILAIAKALDKLQGLLVKQQA